MNISDLFNIAIEYGAERNVPYLLINGTNFLEILRNSDILTLCHSMKDLAGIYILFSTIIDVLNNIHDLPSGKFRLGNTDYSLFTGGYIGDDIAP